ncbi:hypothetical protein X975_07564, partial [Stegodyphus mimosarum]
MELKVLQVHLVLLEPWGLKDFLVSPDRKAFKELKEQKDQKDLKVMSDQEDQMDFQESLVYLGNQVPLESRDQKVIKETKDLEDLKE